MKKIKNDVIKISLCLVIFILLAGCSNTREIDYSQINNIFKVENISMDMKEKDVLESLGSEYTKVPCVLGEEYKFNDLELQIVFDIENRHIIRLTTRSNTSSLYGIKINDKVSNVTKYLLDDNFVKEEGSDYKFKNDNFRITILSQDGITISGFMVDLLENDA